MNTDETPTKTRPTESPRAAMRRQKIERIKSESVALAARNVADLMRANDLDQVRLAGASLVAQKTISNVVNGVSAVRIDNLAALAHALGVPAFALLMPDDQFRRYMADRWRASARTEAAE